MYTARRRVQLKAIKSDWKPQLGWRVSISTSPPTPTPPFLFRSATALCRCLPSFAQSRAPLRHPSIPSSTPHMGAHVQPAYVRQVRQLFGGMAGSTGKEWVEKLGPCLFGDLLGHHASVVVWAQLKLMSYFILLFLWWKNIPPPHPETAIGLFMSRNRREREQLECQRCFFTYK